MAENLSNTNKDDFLIKDLEKMKLKIKKIQYKMDFGSTEVSVKMSLN